MNSTVNAATVATSTKADAAAAYPAVMRAVADAFEALTPEQWRLDTECTGWTVRHLTAHLLGAQEDVLSVPTVLWRRERGRRRHPHLSLLDAANEVQIADHAGLSTAELCQQYRANIAKVAKRVGSFPAFLAGIPVDATMGPGNVPLRLGYLFNVSYLRDAQMHGFDLARATGVQRFATDMDAVVMAQIVRDAATAWGEGPAVELELCRSLSGRIPTMGISTVSGNPQLAHTLVGLRVLF